MPVRLAGARALITGASSGIGAQMARAFVGAGAQVFLTYNVSRKRAESLQRELVQRGGKVWTGRLDLRDRAQISHCMDQAWAALGRIDILVNNAGADILTGMGARESDAEKLQALLDVDLRGTVHACWALRALLRDASSRQGVILNMAWDLALCGLPGVNAQMFAAAKAGVVGFSRSLARDLAPEMRVNVLAPGWIKTSFAESGMGQDYYRARAKDIPLGRFGSVEEVAAVAVFLCSASASYITGEVVNISGGGHLACGAASPHFETSD